MSNPSHRHSTNSAQAYLAAIVDSVDDAIIATTPDGAITSWNMAAKQLFGYTADEVIGKSISMLLPRGLGKGVNEVMKRVRRAERDSHFETALVGKDNQEVDVSLTFSPVKDDSDNLVSVLTIARDITRRKKGTEVRAQRTRELHTLHKLSEMMLSPGSLDELCKGIVKEICAAVDFPIASIALYDEPRQMVRFHGLQTQGTQQGNTILEVPINETVSGIVIRSGKPLIESHVREHPGFGIKAVRQAKVNTFVGYPMRVGERIIGCLNLVHTESIEISPDVAQWIESLANYVAVLVERKRAVEELRRSREQLRELTKSTQFAIEEERKRIAREIHDNLGQELSLLQLELGIIQDRLPKAEKDLRAKTKAMTKLIDSTIRSVQKISTDLRPTLLDNLGLGAAAEWSAREFQKRTKIRCRVSVDPPDLKLDQDHSTALFRILQESLTNILRHAKATRVDVHLVKQKDAIVLEVRDNGKGISLHRITDTRSVGLIGMRERVLPWGGDVAIVGRPGKGTDVIVTIPTSQ